ncbi:MAG: hypothetical protein E3K32_09100 [wastewater metagenome]|nr:hypothetical protein [Candidatus Loosdrechtia aerotolerans]
MASYTYDQFRTVLKRLNFEYIRSGKHETWHKTLPNGTILRVRISHKHGKDIPLLQVFSCVLLGILVINMEKAYLVGYSMKC